MRYEVGDLVELDGDEYIVTDIHQGEGRVIELDNIIRVSEDEIRMAGPHE